jgi:hypothetical protein
MRSPVLLSGLFCVLLVASGAGAQDAWVVSERAALGADVPSIEIAAAREGAPTRVRLSGTLTSLLDGAELDGAHITTDGATDAALGPAVLLSEGAVIVDEDTALHRYVVEAPPGTPIRLTLAVSRLAARRLVTSSELRASLQGAIEIETLRPPAVAPSATLAETAPSATGALAALALALVLSATGAFVLRRREPAEAVLLRRARRASDAIARKARTLGPAFVGCLAPASRLEAAARRSREHVLVLDRALAETRWAESEAARARVKELEARRARVVADLSRVVEQLEVTLVRLTALGAERHAENEVASVVSRMEDELDLGETVEREVAAL